MPYLYSPIYKTGPWVDRLHAAYTGAEKRRVVEDETPLRARNLCRNISRHMPTAKAEASQPRRRHQTSRNQHDTL